VKNTLGTLNLIFRKRQNGKTFLASQHYRLPLQVLTPFYSDDDGTAFVYLLNPSGGILQGDVLETDIIVEKDARGFITTPSANKFYKMDEGHATLTNRIRVEKGGVLEYMPEYNIPFAQSSVVQETEFDIDGEATLLAFDMIVPGRIEKGEVFQYDLYSSKISIRVDGRLLAHEVARIQPNETDPRGTGIMEGHTIYGTVFLYHKNLDLGLKASLNEVFRDWPEVTGGVTYLTESLAVVKFLGNHIHDCQGIVHEIWRIARESMLGKDIVRMRKY
jgi:urease accessory protein